jgi:hypothetical protein
VSQGVDRRIGWSGGGTGGVDDFDARPEITTVVNVDTATVPGGMPLPGLRRTWWRSAR